MGPIFGTSGWIRRDLGRSASITAFAEFPVPWVTAMGMNEDRRVGKSISGRHSAKALAAAIVTGPIRRRRHGA
jgi:hypothetical protein